MQNACHAFLAVMITTVRYKRRAQIALADRMEHQHQAPPAAAASANRAPTRRQDPHQTQNASSATPVAMIMMLVHPLRVLTARLASTKPRMVLSTALDHAQQGRMLPQVPAETSTALATSQ